MTKGPFLLEKFFSRLRHKRPVFLFLPAFNHFFLVCLASAFFARLLAYGYVHEMPGMRVLLRALIDDACVSLVLAALLTPLRKLPVLTVALLAFYMLALAGNIINISVNAANLSIEQYEFLFEPEFMASSLLSADIIMLCAGLGAWALSIHILLTSQRARRWLAHPAFLMAPILSLCALWLPVSSDIPLWQQLNPLEENTALAFSGSNATFNDTPEVQREYKRLTELDLSGAPLTQPMQKPRPNVLLIMVEGLSDQMLKKGFMPYVGQLAEQNIYLPNFVYHQRHTANGIYSIMCGDMPTMYRYVKLLRVTRKATVTAVEVSHENNPSKWGALGVNGSVFPCMPSVFEQQNYVTAFFQASSLELANKDAVTKAMGFENRYSDRDLKNKYPKVPEDAQQVRQGFSMSDNRFFPRAAREIAALDKSSDKPWFAALMTTGTHYPLSTPRRLPPGKSPQAAAFGVTDGAIRGMLSLLRKAGALENTLIIITGDESAAGFAEPGIGGMLWGNHGTLVAVTPRADRYQSMEYFTQSDLMTSVLDYAGYDAKARVGRSIFRNYNDKFRPLMMANIYLSRFYAWPEPGKLIACANFFKNCSNFMLEGPLFGGTLQKDSFDKNLVDLYIQVAKKSDAMNLKKSSRRIPEKKSKVKVRVI